MMSFVPQHNDVICITSMTKSTYWKKKLYHRRSVVLSSCPEELHWVPVCTILIAASFLLVTHIIADGLFLLSLIMWNSVCAILLFGPDYEI